MGARIIRQKLFDEAEKREIHHTLLKMELEALKMIAEQPEKREAVIVRLNQAAEKFVGDVVRKKRIEGIVFGGVMMVVGFLMVWIGGDEMGRLLARFGMMAIFSGIGTAIINWALWACRK